MQMVRLLESLLMPAERTGPCRLFVRKFSSESASLSVPVEAVIEADVHYVPPYDEKSFLSYLRNDLDALALPEGCSWKVEIPVRKTPYIPPYATSENDGAVRKFLQSYGQRIGNYAISYGMSVADENIIAASGVPIVTVGPRGGGAHSNGEWISKSDYLLLAEKMPEIVQDFVDKRS
jgi:acetylornithine deacetylase/succinyl-diaminopimelate desuccinylase-like protein